MKSIPTDSKLVRTIKTLTRVEDQLADLQATRAKLRKELVRAALRHNRIRGGLRVVIGRLLPLAEVRVTEVKTIDAALLRAECPETAEKYTRTHLRTSVDVY